jgi:hypothetical protein
MPLFIRLCEELRDEHCVDAGHTMPTVSWDMSGVKMRVLNMRYETSPLLVMFLR